MWIQDTTSTKAVNHQSGLNDRVHLYVHLFRE